MSDTLPTYPVVNPAFTASLQSENRVEFRAGPWSGPMVAISEPEGAGGPAALVEALDGETPVEAVIEAADRGSFDARSTLDRLVRKRIVVEATGDADAYLSRRVRSDDEPPANRVLVAGDGATAAALLDDLIGLNSADVRVLDVGMTPESIPGGVPTVQPEEFDAALSRTDHLISVTDRPRPSVEERLNDAAIDAGLRFTRARIDGYDAVIGPTVVPAETACFECYRRRRDATLSSPDGYRRHLDRRRASTETSVPAPFASLVAGVLGVELRNQLVDGFGFTGGRILHYDLFDLTVEANDVLRLPRCPVCRDRAATVDDPRHATLDSLFTELSADD